MQLKFNPEPQPLKQYFARNRTRARLLAAADDLLVLAVAIASAAGIIFFWFMP